LSGYVVLRLAHDEVVSAPARALDKIREVVRYRAATPHQEAHERQPGPLQVLFLWGLLARGGEGWKTDLKPELKGRYAPLRRSGLLEEEGRPTRTPVDPQMDPALGGRLGLGRGSPGRPGIPALDRGGTGAPGGAHPAQGVPHGNRRAPGRDDLPQTVAAGPTPAAPAPPLAARIRSAYLADSAGDWGVRVRLAALRRSLGDVSRPVLDAALLELARTERLALYPLDDPLDVTDADREAAIERLGQRFHLVYMDPGA